MGDLKLLQLFANALEPDVRYSMRFKTKKDLHGGFVGADADSYKVVGGGKTEQKDGKTSYTMKLQMRTLKLNEETSTYEPDAFVYARIEVWVRDGWDRKKMEASPWSTEPEEKVPQFKKGEKPEVPQITLEACSVED